MIRLALTLLFLSLPVAALAQSIAPAPSVTLTQDELTRHNAAVAANAVAQSRIADAQDVETKITSTFQPKPLSIVKPSDTLQ